MINELRKTNKSLLRIILETFLLYGIIEFFAMYNSNILLAAIFPIIWGRDWLYHNIFFVLVEFIIVILFCGKLKTHGFITILSVTILLNWLAYLWRQRKTSSQAKAKNNITSESVCELLYLFKDYMT